MMRKLFNKQHNEPEFTVEDEVEVIHALWETARGNDIVFGAPTRCPTCGDWGVIEGVDDTRTRCENTCPRCGSEWTITRRAIHAAGPMPDHLRERASEPQTETAVRTQIHDDVIEVQPTLADDLRLLLVEDDPADVELMRMILAPFAAQKVRVVHVKNKTDAQKVIAQRGSFDVVLLDLGLSESSGLTTLTEWRSLNDPAPVVVLSSNDHPGLADATRRAGAAAFMHKRELVDPSGAPVGGERFIQQLRNLAAPRYVKP